MHARRSHDGTIDKREFRSNVKAIGVEATVEELDDLFDTLDTDGGGELDVAELKVALKTLQDESALSAQRIRKLKKLSVDLAKKMKDAQEEWRQLLLEDEAAAAREASRKAEEVAMAEKAEAEARAAREAAEEAKRQREEGKRQAFEAKIAEKRARGGRSALVGSASVSA